MDLLTREQFNLLFKNSNSFVFFMEKEADDYKYVFVNDSAQNSLLSGTVIGKRLSEIMPPSSHKIVLDNYNQAVKDKEQIEYHDYICLAGEVRKYENMVFPSFVDGKTYILAITKETSYDRDFEDKYLFMRSVFFNTFLSTVMVSKNGRILEVNPQFLDDFKVDLEEVRGQNFLDLPIINLTEKETLQYYIAEVGNGRSITSKLLTFIDSERKCRTFTATFSPLLRANNELVAIFIVLQEITHYIQQEQALRVTSNGLNKFKNAINTAVEVSITDINGIIIDVNNRFVEQTGYLREELIGNTYDLINSRYHKKQFFNDLWKVVRSGEVWRGEICIQTKYGVPYWVDTTIIPLTDEEGHIEQFLSIHFNITEKKRMLTELHNIESMFKMITENTSDLIVITNEDGIIQFASNAYVRKLGYRREELVGQFYSEILTKESQEIWYAELSKLQNNAKIELIHEAKSGDILWTECNYTGVKDYLRNGGQQIIMVCREITERKEFENKLLFLAYHDALTQLPNRRYLKKEFPHILEQSRINKESIAVLYVDGDNFKEVNDQFGHDIGDQFINEFGKSLASSVRSQDLVARIGGDEFVIVLTYLEKNALKREWQLKQIIQRIQENLQTGWDIEGHHFSPTSSIGIAFYPDHGASLNVLLDKSDQALHEIKASSKNNYRIFSSI